MKLLTKELLTLFAKQGDTSQKEAKDVYIIAKFFNPTGQGTWYAADYDPDTRLFFGYVSIFGDWNDEAGSFSLDELENIKLPMGLGIERDRLFRPNKYTLEDLMDGSRP